jgi:hypothetical protein
MWTVILPSSGTFIGGIIIHVAIRRCRAKPTEDSGILRKGCLLALVQAIEQMFLLHLFDRFKKVYIRTNPKRVQAADQIEAVFLKRLGLNTSVRGKNSKPQRR